jgi:hypothetical protein
MSIERRHHNRFHIAQAIEIEFPKEIVFEADGIDLSETGLRILTRQDMEIYAKVFIMMKTGNMENDKFYFDAVVIWKKGANENYEYGLKITDINHDSLLKLKKFIKRP